MNVLLVDDEAHVQQIVAGFLERYASERSIPVSLKALGDPIRGLFEATANGASYDMIILEMHLPKLTGDEIYHSLKHVHPDLRHRVLFVTAHADELQKRFPAEPLRVLPKPFRYQQLAGHIETIVKPR